MDPPPAASSGGGILSDSPISLALSVGYDNEYIWRGADLGKDLTWFDVSLGYSITDDLSFTLGAWQATWRSGDELDIYASLDYSLGAVDLSLGWIYYYFYGPGSDYHEYSLGASTSLGPIDLGLTYYIAPAAGLEYDYVELSAGTSFELTENMSLDLGVALGWGDKDFIAFQGGPLEDSLTHFGANAALNIALYENLTLSPYIATSIPLDELDGPYGDEFYGGISLGVEF